jgi:hypothetical protein
MAVIPTLWRWAWPLVGIVPALLVNIAWIAALTYGFARMFFTRQTPSGKSSARSHRSFDK